MKKSNESVGHDTRFSEFGVENNRISAEILLIIVIFNSFSKLQRKSAIFGIIWSFFVILGIFNTFSKSQRKWDYFEKLNSKFGEKWPELRMKCRFISGNETILDFRKLFCRNLGRFLSILLKTNYHKKLTKLSFRSTGKGAKSLWLWHVLLSES